MKNPTLKPHFKQGYLPPHPQMKLQKYASHPQCSTPKIVITFSNIQSTEVKGISMLFYSLSDCSSTKSTLRRDV